MKNLGKIVLLLLLFTSTIFANVTAKVVPSEVHVGDSATYMLKIDGSNIKKPSLSDICGNDIVSTGSQTSIESINGSYKKTYTLSYEFVAKNSCTIAPTAVEVNGNIEHSNSVNITVKPRSQDLSADFVLSLKASKKELYVGEPFTLTLFLKQKNGAEAVDSKFVAPEFKGFWMKSESKPQRMQDGEYIVTKLTYKLAPQRAGELKIEPAELKIATRIGVNNWGTLIPQVRWRSYYSNSVNLNVKPLPNNAKIVGDFTIRATVESREVNANEPVNVVVTVSGEGNLEDIESFKPYVQGVNVFDEKIVIQGDTLTQKLVFVSDTNFTVPSFELVYFDTKTAQVKKIKTDPIAIEVHGATQQTPLKIMREQTTAPTQVNRAESTQATVAFNPLYAIAIFLGGIVFGALGMYFLSQKRVQKQNMTKLDLKNEKLLLVKLLPYKEVDEDVAKVIEILENNLYSSTKKEMLDKKLLKELVKRHNIT